MKITREQVIRVAELAHLELSEAELDVYSRQLDDILAYIEKLNQLDTSQVEPMAGGTTTDFRGQAVERSGGPENPALREDAVKPSGVAPAVLDGAPDPSRPFFRVPKVIEK